MTKSAALWVALFVVVPMAAAHGRLVGNQAKLIAHGKYLVEVPSGLPTGAQLSGLEGPGFLPLSRVRASQQHPQMELVGVASN